MTVKRLMEILSKIENKETEIQIKNSYNALGNISSLQQVEKTTYSFFGENIDCIVFDTKINSDEEAYKDFICNNNTLYEDLNELEKVIVDKMLEINNTGMKIVDIYELFNNTNNTAVSIVSAINSSEDKKILERIASGSNEGKFYLTKSFVEEFKNRKEED